MSFTGNITAVLGKDLAASLGRKGTESDVTLYNHKMGDTVLAFVEPAAYPEKIQSLVTALDIADQVLFKVTELNSFFAESLVTLDSLGMERGFLILGPDIMAENLKNFLSGTVLSKYQVIEEQVVSIREKLAEDKPEAKGDVVVQIDHSFPVKGVGTVALGVVKQGVLKRHDELTLYPTHVKAQVKSIQVSDVDVEDASRGVRVGIGLKNLRPEDVPRGTILAREGAIQVADTISLNAGISKFSPVSLSVGDAFMISTHLSYVPAKVLDGAIAQGKTGTVKISLERKIPLLPGRMLFLDPGQKMPRVFGFGEAIP
jgi:selenocysteine-specific translation elongation factor